MCRNGNSARHVITKIFSDVSSDKQAKAVSTLFHQENEHTQTGHYENTLICIDEIIMETVSRVQQRNSGLRVIVETLA